MQLKSAAGTSFTEKDDELIQDFDKDWQVMEYPKKLINQGFLDEFCWKIINDATFRTKFASLAYKEDLLGLQEKAKEAKKDEIQRAKQEKLLGTKI
jgi:hypothetical protein